MDAIVLIHDVYRAKCRQYVRASAFCPMLYLFGFSLTQIRTDLTQQIQQLGDILTAKLIDTMQQFLRIRRE